MRSKGITAILLFLVTGLSASPQTSTTAQTGHIVTSREFLTQRNIELTEASLVTALRNPDPHVRYWSALVLAEENARDAVPAISEALQSEKVPETKGNIALALAQLGDPKGLATLQDLCRDINVPATVRVYSAMYTLVFSNQGCLGSLLEIVVSTADSGTRALAVAQLPRFGKVSEDDSKRIDAATLRALKDTSPEVRLAASAAISKLATPALTLALQNSIATESDEGIKSLMIQDLKNLQNSTHP